MCINSLNKDFIERKKHFDSIFGTNTLNNVDFNNLPMLRAIFEYFDEDIYKPSAKYEELRKQSIEVSNKLESTLKDKQKEMFEEYWELQNKVVEEEQQQMFYFGFLVAKELEKETNLITK